MTSLMMLHCSAVYFLLRLTLTKGIARLLNRVTTVSVRHGHPHSRKLSSKKSHTSATIVASSTVVGFPREAASCDFSTIAAPSNCGIYPHLSMKHTLAVVGHRAVDNS